MLLLSLKNDWQPLLFESGRCKNLFVDYKINYEKLCYSLQKIWPDPMCEYVYLISLQIKCKIQDKTKQCIESDSTDHTKPSNFLNIYPVQGSRFRFFYVVHWTSKFGILWNYRVHLKFMWSRNSKISKLQNLQCAKTL